MKKTLSLLLAIILIISVFSGVFAVNAAAGGFETDFSDFSSTACFKKIYDSNGKEIVGKFAFNITDDGLRYFREADEVFYNPSGGDRTHLLGHNVFPVSKTGKSSDIFAITANTCYKIELSYNCVTLGNSATITLGAAFAPNGGNADHATNGKAKRKDLTTTANGTESVIISELGINTAVGYLTISDVPVDGSTLYDRLYILLNSTAKSDIDITVTSLKISTLPSIILHDVNSGNQTHYFGEAGAPFALEEEKIEESYLINSKSQYIKKPSTLYADSALETAVSNATFPTSGSITYYVANENVTIENQVAFCGFDSFTTRKTIKNQSNATIGFKELSDAIPSGAQISDEAAYTGSKALKFTADSAADKAVYIGSGYELKNGATYRLSLHYRAVDTNNTGDVTLRFTSGNSASDIIKSDCITANTQTIAKASLNDGTVWKTAVLYYTADVKGENADLYLAPVLNITTSGAAGVYIDTCIISKVVESAGTSVLKAEADGKQALRFYFSYDANGEEIIVDSKKLSIEKRGMLYAAEDKLFTLSDLNLTSAESNPYIYKTETDNLSNCWDYDADSEKITYSAYLKDIEEKHYDKKLAIRGYLILSDGTVFYSEIINESVNSVKEKSGKRDMYYELVDVSGTDYKNLHIYIPTSDPSGKYFIRYNMYYTYSEQPEDITLAQKANTGYNQETYRIKGAELVEKNGDSFTVKMQNILHAGELELAIKEKGASDFIGGYHGDEIMKYARFYVDGKEISLKSQAEGIVQCNNITFETDTTMYRCASGTAENKVGTAVCEHYLYYTFNSKDGIVVDQKVNWLVGDFKNDVPMVCMFTIGRYSGKTKITDIVEYYKWDGSYVDTVDATGYGQGAEGFGYSSYNGPAYAIAYSKDSGYKATVGYKNIKGLTDTFQNYVWIRPYNDNKVYYKANAGRTNAIGEVWEWTNYFNFDYVTPEN